MKKFAYIGKGGIMHIVKEYDTAKKYKEIGKVVEIGIKAEGGYPLNAEGEGVIVYSPEVMKITADGENIKPIAELAELYKKCM